MVRNTLALLPDGPEALLKLYLKEKAVLTDVSILPLAEEILQKKENPFILLSDGSFLKKEAIDSVVINKIEFPLSEPRWQVRVYGKQAAILPFPSEEEARAYAAFLYNLLTIDYLK